MELIDNNFNVLFTIHLNTLVHLVSCLWFFQTTIINFFTMCSVNEICAIRCHSTNCRSIMIRFDLPIVILYFTLNFVQNIKNNKLICPINLEIITKKLH